MLLLSLLGFCAGVTITAHQCSVDTGRWMKRPAPCFPYASQQDYHLPSPSSFPLLSLLFPEPKAAFPFFFPLLTPYTQYLQTKGKLMATPAGTDEWIAALKPDRSQKPQPQLVSCSLKGTKGWEPCRRQRAARIYSLLYIHLFAIGRRTGEEQQA